jgi:hypothetical protein
MTHHRRATDRQPRWLLPLLVLLIVLGSISVGVTVAAARDAGLARAADLERTEALVDRLSQLQARRAEDAETHQHRTEAIHRQLCEIVVDIARQAGLHPLPCLDPPEDPDG